MLYAVTLLSLNLLAFGLMVWRGAWPERAAAAWILACILVEGVAQTIMLNNWRIGVAAVNLVLFLGLWLICERANRWWLVFVAGFQFMALLTHVLPLITDQNTVLTGVLARRGVWIAITITLFLAPWEAWADRKYRSGEPSHDLLRRRGAA